MNSKYLRLFLILVLFSAYAMHAQDTILLKNGAEINARVIERSDSEIKYVTASDNLVIAIKTKYIEKITLHDGSIMNLDPFIYYSGKRLGINTGLMYGLFMEAAFYKIQADYAIIPEINLEIDGLIGVEGEPGIAIGVKHYFDPYKPKKFKTYTGLMIGSAYDSFFMQIPFGLDYTARSGFNVKFDIAGHYVPEQSFAGIYLQLLLGWRF